MKETTFKSQFTVYHTDGEINNEPSQTVPDQSLTVKQLLINHTKGIHSDINDNGQGYFDTEIPVIQDITDLQRIKDELIQKRNWLQNEIDEHVRQKKQSEVSSPDPTPKTPENE